MSKRRKHDISGKNLVGFEVANVAYAIDIQRVREILRPLATVALPHVPDIVVGVCDHRGDVIPIIDLRKRFAVNPVGRERDARWIIVSRDQRLLGLAVDRVTEVFGADDSEARELPQIAAGEHARGIKGAFVHRGQLVFVLDVDRVTEVAESIAWPSPATPEADAVRDG
jgi:purine-binding chemotaxis protein CheW